MKSQSKLYQKWIVVCVIVMTTISVSTESAQAYSFRDVSPVYAESIYYLTDKDYTNGISTTQFGTNDAITRGSVAVILATALDLLMDTPEIGQFSDVPSRAVQAVNSLQRAGIIQGKSMHYFGFTEPIKRGEMALMLSHSHAYALQGDAGSITFRDVNSRYVDAIAGLVSNDITKGKSTTRFGTDDLLKRGEFAVLLYRAEMNRITKEMATMNSQLQEKLTTGQVQSIKLIGDSITAGVGVDGYSIPADGRVILEEGTIVHREASLVPPTWANQLRSYTKTTDIDFLNAGVSGKTAAWTLKHLDGLVSSEEDVVFVMLGTNDRLDSELVQYEQTIRTLLQKVDERSELMIVMAPPPSVNSIAKYHFSPESIDNVLKRISHEKGYVFVSHYDGINTFLSTHSHKTYRDVMETNSPHPTTEGYQVMWETLQQQLQLN